MRHPGRSTIRPRHLIRLGLLVFTGLLIPHSAALAQSSDDSLDDTMHRYPCPEQNRTQIELGGCAAQLQKSAERYLKETYENVLPRVNGAKRTALRTSQAAWAHYRDRDCDVNYEAFRGGSIAQEEYGLCMAWSASVRGRELERIFGVRAWPSRTKETIACLGPGVAEAEVLACATPLYAVARGELDQAYRSVLEEIFSSPIRSLAKVKMQEAQWTWGRYRDADCELVRLMGFMASGGHTSSDAARIVCLTILTQERTRRLRDLW